MYSPFPRHPSVFSALDNNLNQEAELRKYRNHKTSDKPMIAFQIWSVSKSRLKKPYMTARSEFLHWWQFKIVS